MLEQGERLEEGVRLARLEGGSVGRKDVQLRVARQRFAVPDGRTDARRLAKVGTGRLRRRFALPSPSLPGCPPNVPASRSRHLVAGRVRSRRLWTALLPPRRPLGRCEGFVGGWGRYGQDVGPEVAIQYPGLDEQEIDLGFGEGGGFLGGRRARNVFVQSSRGMAVGGAANRQDVAALPPGLDGGGVVWVARPPFGLFARYLRQFTAGNGSHGRTDVDVPPPAGLRPCLES